MHDRQRGITVSGLIVWLVVFIFLALLAMKLIPSYMEYASARNAIQAISRERNAATPADVRRFFDQRAQIDDITVIKGSDLEVTKQGNDMVISFTYRKDVPLFANVGLYLDFAADTGQ
jgi:Tfp pilus assembly protein PilE